MMRIFLVVTMISLGTASTLAADTSLIEETCTDTECSFKCAEDVEFRRKKLPWSMAK